MKEKQYLYQNIYYDLKQMINKNYLKEGDFIDNEFDLAKKYNVSRHTVRKALDLLEEDGYISRVSGHGTFIRKRPRAKYLLSSMKSYTEMMLENNRFPKSIILSAKEIPVTHEIRKNLETNEEFCYYVERLRLADSEIMCLEQTYINKSLCPNIIDYINSETSLFDLYENKYKLKIDSGLFDLHAINCPLDISKKLNIKENDAVLNMVANIKLKNDKILYHVDAFYIGEKYNFTTILKRN